MTRTLLQSERPDPPEKPTVKDTMHIVQGDLARLPENHPRIVEAQEAQESSTEAMQGYWEDLMRFLNENPTPAPLTMNEAIHYGLKDLHFYLRDTHYRIRRCALIARIINLEHLIPVTTHISLRNSETEDISLWREQVETDAEDRWRESLPPEVVDFYDRVNAGFESQEL